MFSAITACQNYTPAACREALEAVLLPTGALDWVQPGIKIAIKANLVAAMKPESAATTHPVLLCALVDLLVERGAEVIVGDSPGGIYTSAYVNLVYRATGMDAVVKHGAKLNQDFSQRVAEYPQAVTLKSFQYTAWLDSCDAAINFCKLKSHGMMAMSAGTKNLFGTIPGTLKPEYHYRFPELRSFAHMLVDLAEYWRPRLTIVDAVVGMEGNGPTAGTPRPIGAVIAGDNPHAVDLICAKMIDIPRDEVPTLEAALERGLIPAGVDELNVLGDITPFIIPDFQKLETKNRMLFQDKFKGSLGLLFSPFMKRNFSPRPTLHKAQCIGCRKCANICPAKAIHMRNNKPVIHRKACIHCFCCQEFCPKGALKVARPPLAKLLNR